jgi:hypothetical protein
VFENPAGSAALREKMFCVVMGVGATKYETKKKPKSLSHTEAQGTQRKTFFCV